MKAPRDIEGTLRSLLVLALLCESGLRDYGFQKLRFLCVFLMERLS